MNYFYIIEGKIRNNIGDVLQGMAAAQYLPHPSMPVDRESLSDLNPHQPAFMISNGWFMHDFSKFPPPPNVYPLYISVHVSNSELLKSMAIRDHFRKYAPIGCRDRKTLRLFLGWGIPAYYSGCLTTTLEKPLHKVVPDPDKILLVDNVDHPVPLYILTQLENLYHQKIIQLDHNPKVVADDFSSYVRAGKNQMENLLHTYCSAKLIVTTKIHCALPCLGMGLPVVLIHPNPSDPRLHTVKEFIPVISYEALMQTKAPPKVFVNNKRLKARQSLLSSIVEQSVRMNVNIIKNPTSFQFFLIKYLSIISAHFYGLMISLLLRLRISPQINRVYKR